MHEPLSQAEEAVAREKGRRLAAWNMMQYADVRQRVEDVYGVAYCKNRYPEAYCNSLELQRKLASMDVHLL